MLLWSIAALSIWVLRAVAEGVNEDVHLDEDWLKGLEKWRGNKAVNVEEIYFTGFDPEKGELEPHREIFVETMEMGEPQKGFAWFVAYKDTEDVEAEIGEPMVFRSRYYRRWPYNTYPSFDRRRTKHVGVMRIKDLIKAQNLLRKLPAPKCWQPQAHWLGEFTQPRYQCGEWAEDGIKLLWQHRLLHKGRIPSDELGWKMRRAMREEREKRMLEFQEEQRKWREADEARKAKLAKEKAAKQTEQPKAVKQTEQPMAAKQAAKFVMGHQKLQAPPVHAIY